MDALTNTDTSNTPNRKFKDGMFRALFKDPDKFRELSNYALGTEYGPDTPMEETTLSSALYIVQKNDVSFLLDNRLIIFTEHQSTLSPNIALRLLIYAADTYKARFSVKSMHDSRQLTLPRPYFFVLYNGMKKVPPVQKIHLSKMFAEWPGPKKPPFSLDLEFTLYDINSNNNPEILRRCETLAQYETFVELVHKHRKKHILEEAVPLATDECMRRGILTEFLTIHAKDILDMLKTEITLEEIREMDLEAGMEKERRKVVAAMKAEGMDVNTIARITGLTTDEILRM